MPATAEADGRAREVPRPPTRPDKKNDPRRHPPSSLDRHSMYEMPREREVERLFFEGLRKPIFPIAATYHRPNRSIVVSCARGRDILSPGMPHAPLDSRRAAGVDVAADGSRRGTMLEGTEGGHRRICTRAARTRWAPWRIAANRTSFQRLTPPPPAIAVLDRRFGGGFVTHDGRSTRMQICIVVGRMSISWTVASVHAARSAARWRDGGGLIDGGMKYVLALLIERRDPLKSLERFPLENREDDDVWRGTETERGR